MLTKRDAKALPWVLLIFVVLLLMNPSAAGLKLVMGAIGLCAIGGTVRFVLMLIVTRDYGQKPKPLPVMEPELTKEKNWNHSNANSETWAFAKLLTAIPCNRLKASVASPWPWPFDEQQ
jgi:hypothetical protein